MASRPCEQDFTVIHAENAAIFRRRRLEVRVAEGKNQIAIKKVYYVIWRISVNKPILLLVYIIHPRKFNE